MMNISRLNKLFSIILLVALIQPFNSFLFPVINGIGCAPLTELSAWGPDPYSMEGVLGIDNKSVGPWVPRSVIVVEPDSIVNLTFSLKVRADYGNLLIEPYFWFFQATPSYSSWLNVSYSSEIVGPMIRDEVINVTVTLEISDDAPLGEFAMVFGGKIPSEDLYQKNCVYGPLDFVMRIGEKKPDHAFTISYISASSEGYEDVIVFTDNNVLKGILLTIDKNESIELKFNLSSVYPRNLFFGIDLVNQSSAICSNLFNGLESQIVVDGSRFNDYDGIIRYAIDQHNSANVTLRLSIGEGVKEGSYSTLFILDAYDVPPPFGLPPVESIEIPITLWVGRNAPISKTETVLLTSTTTTSISITSIKTSTISITDTSTVTEVLTTSNNTATIYSEITVMSELSTDFTYIIIGILTIIIIILAVINFRKN